MYSSEDFEKLWFLYKLECESKNVSIESFYFQQGIPCELFNKWFSSRKKSIVLVDIIGIPEEGHVEDVDCRSLASCPNPESSSSVATVVISLFNGVQISKRHLSYVDLWFGRKVGGSMLTISGLENFYYLPHFHDMRCGYSHILEIIRMNYRRKHYKGNVFFFMYMETIENRWNDLMKLRPIRLFHVMI